MTMAIFELFAAPIDTNTLFSRPGALATSPPDSATQSALPAAYVDCSAWNPATQHAPWLTW